MSYDFLPSANLQYFLTKLRTKFAGRDTIAEDFSTSTSYAVGDYCIYDNTLYKFTSAHQGAWNAAHASSTQVVDELGSGGGGGGGSMATLSDVTLTSLTDGDNLKYDATASKWKNYQNVIVTTTDPGEGSALPTGVMLIVIEEEEEEE